MPLASPASSATSATLADAVGRAQQQALGGVEDRVVALLLVFGLDGALANDHVHRPSDDATLTDLRVT